MLTMHDREVYRAGMEEVMAATGFRGDVAAFKKRVYSGAEFQRAKRGEMTSDEMWGAIFSNANAEESPPSAAADCDEVARNVDRWRYLVRVNGRWVHPHFIAFVEDLKRRGIAVGILSNYESDLLQVMDALGVRQLFGETNGDKHIVSSFAIRSAKPELTAFTEAMRLLDIGGEPSSASASSAVSASGTSLMINDVQEADETMFTEDSSNVLGNDVTEPTSVTPPLPRRLQFPNVIFVDDKAKNVESARNAGIAYSIVYQTLEQCVRDVEQALERIH